MFHVLTRFSSWAESSDQIMSSRIYLSEDKTGNSHFMKGGEPNLEEIRKYPALLVQEPQADNPQPARVVSIQNIYGSAKYTYTIEYVADQQTTPIPSENIVELLQPLGLSSGHLNHSCWRFVKHDLFKMLLRHEQRMRLRPSVFNINALYQPDPDLVSVMMPFSAEFNPVYEAIKDGVEAAGFKCKRADDIWVNQHIIQDVVDLIASAKIVICDLSGKNSNVFYEAGIAHTLGKEIILLTQHMDDVPFDLKALRCLRYHNIQQGLDQLRQELTKKLMDVLR